MIITLIVCALLTIVIEALFFLLAGPRHRDFLIVCILVNGITNLALNMLLYGCVAFLGIGRDGYSILTAVFECCIVPVEYWVYCQLLYRKPKLHIPLFLKTLLANCLTCGIGILIDRAGGWPWTL